MPIDPWNLLTALSLGIEAARYAKGYLDGQRGHALAAELQALYFDRILFDQISAPHPDWDAIEQGALDRLFNSRNQVADALARMSADGFRETLSLKDRRLFEEMINAKRIIRTELIDAIRSTEFRNDADYRNLLLSKIKELNELIEELDPRHRAARG